jgi:UV DNA damage repair endonuclease
MWADFWGAVYTWDEIEEDLYRYREGLGLCELERTSLVKDVHHRLAMERVQHGRQLRSDRGELVLRGRAVFKTLFHEVRG